MRKEVCQQKSVYFSGFVTLAVEFAEDASKGLKGDAQRFLDLHGVSRG